MAEIEIEFNDRRVQYTAAGGEVEFEYDFPIYLASHLIVVETDDDGNQTVLTQGDDYDVSGVGAEAGGLITLDASAYPTGAPEDYIYTLYSYVPEERLSDYQYSGDFTAAEVNKDFDAQIMMLQQLRRDLFRAPLLDITDSLTALPIKVESSADRAGRAFAFNYTGDGIEAGPLLPDLETIADYLDEIDTVSDNIASVNTVATDLNGTDTIGTVAGSITNVNTVGAAIANVNTVAGAIANVNTVAGDIADVNTVAGAIANVNAVGTDIANVNTVASNIADVNTVATNIADVQNAEENANIAKAAGGYTYTYDTTTTATDPGAGKVQFNNATLGSATAMYISETSGLAQAIASDLATWDDGTSTIRGRVRMFLQSNPAVFALFDITGSLTDNGGWDSFTVSYVGGAGTFADNDVVTMQFAPKGDKGDTGATGPAGSLDFTALSAETSPDTADIAVINDVSEGGGTNNKITLGNLWKVLNTFTEDTAPDGTADFMATYDTSATSSKKVKLNTLFTLINSLTAETAPDVADLLALYDASASTGDKITLENFFKVINTFTTDGSPVWGSDYIPTYDASASLPKKVLISSIVSLLLSQVNNWTVAQRGAVIALTDGATVTPDFSAGNNFSWTIGGNRTLANPTNQTAGQSGIITITQDGTGSRIITWGSNWLFAGGTEPTLSTAASAKDILSYYVLSSGNIYCTFAKAFA